MAREYKNGQTAVILRVKLLDSASTSGAGLTGLTSASSGLVISTIADNELNAVAYTVAGSTIEAVTTIGTYSAPTATKCRFKLVDNTNHPGVYEIQLADARFAVASAKSLLVSISGVSGMVQADYELSLTSDDPYVAKPTNSNLLSIDASGRVDIGKLLGTAWLTPGTAGTPDVNVKLWNGLTTVALPLVPTTAGRTLVVDAAGLADANVVKLGPTGAGTAQTARDVGGNVDVVVSTRATPAQVTSAIVTELVTTTYAEPGSIPAATASLKDKLGLLFTLARNKFTQTATTGLLRNDGDSATIGTVTVSDDATTFVRSKII